MAIENSDEIIKAMTFNSVVPKHHAQTLSKNCLASGLFLQA